MNFEDRMSTALENIRNKTMSIRKAAVTYNIPKSTLYDRVSGRFTEDRCRKGPECFLSLEEEKRVTKWIIDICRCGFPLKRDDLLNTVQKIIKDSGKSTRFKDHRSGKTWLKLFFQRNPILATREAENINKARAVVTEASIREWFSELKEYLRSSGQEDVMDDPSRIFNGDETSFSLCPKTGKVIGPKGFKNIYKITSGNEKETITVLITFSAVGDMLPPMVIFPYLRPPKDIVNSMPESWFLGRTESGWMRTETFFEYIANGFDKWLEEKKVKRPVILFVDGHKSHLNIELSQFCNEKNIILYALPPNTTHIMQPADVSLFRPLKMDWKQTVCQWQSQNLGKTLTKKDFCPLLQKAFRDYSSTIQNGFRKCGLYPLDPDAVDYSKCVKTYNQKVLDTLPEENVQQRCENKYKIASSVIRELSSKLRACQVDPDAVLEVIAAEITSVQGACLGQDPPFLQVEETRTSQPQPVEDCNLSKISILDVSLDDIDIPSGIFTINDEGVLELAKEKSDDNNNEPGAAIVPSCLPSTSSVTSSGLATHLFYPKPIGFTGKRFLKNGYRSPSAISSKGWRDIHLKKEQEKQRKQDAIDKRKEERLAKRNEKKKRRVVRRQLRPIKTCPACNEELVSDVEDDGLKNIGCDTCPVWFHLKCTSLKDLSYLEAANSLFICPSCDV